MMGSDVCVEHFAILRQLSLGCAVFLEASKAFLLSLFILITFFFQEGLILFSDGCISLTCRLINIHNPECSAYLFAFFILSGQLRILDQGISFLYKVNAI